MEEAQLKLPLTNTRSGAVQCCDILSSFAWPAIDDGMDSRNDYLDAIYPLYL